MYNSLIATGEGRGNNKEDDGSGGGGSGGRMASWGTAGIMQPLSGQSCFTTVGSPRSGVAPCRQRRQESIRRFELLAAQGSSRMMTTSGFTKTAHAVSKLLGKLLKAHI